MIRGAAVADAFYPADKEVLSGQVEAMLARAKVSEQLKDAISFVAPHAGYNYSGAIAAYAYNAVALQSKARKIDTYVIIGPNHTGMGEPIAVSKQDWRTPLGIVKNDAELANQIISASPSITADEEAHMEEHSIEVQLPFLQSVVASPRCVFICMGRQSYDLSYELAMAIGKAEQKLKRNVTVIASSDMNHYESAETAGSKDMPALRAIERLEAKQFHELIKKSHDSACGYGPMAVSALFGFDHGARKGVLLKYGNSGEETGDYKSVVAYASMAFVPA